MPMWATILILALAIAVLWLVWRIIKLNEELSKTQDAIRTHWQLQYAWSDFVRGDLLKLCTAIRNGDTTVDCSMYAGKSPPDPPDYP